MWLPWVFLVVDFARALVNTEDAISIANGEFEAYRELWNGLDTGAFMICSEYEKPLVVAFAMTTKNDGRHLMLQPTASQSYLIEYDPLSNMDLFVCYPTVGKPGEAVDRFLANWELDVPLKSFMFNNYVLINSTHVVDSLQLSGQEPGLVDHSLCPLKTIDQALDGLPSELKNQIEKCFAMNGDQPTPPYCAFKSNENGESIFEIIEWEHPILYHLYNITVFYKPKNDFNHDVFVYDHESDFTYFIPKNLTTFKDDWFPQEHVVSIRIPFVKRSDEFFKRRDPSTSTETTVTTTETKTTTEDVDCLLAPFIEKSLSIRFFLDYAFMTLLLFIVH
ncbi:hypothetical protein M3Y94_00613800 [Aphelenchoides besseyi]|nr:hypothetical protein M3Y94_00613800 [Aphelenchoides besseyi]KAI6216329.1 hypothetical protein M3Y95_01283500 [Aphelenchoides besseyi]